MPITFPPDKFYGAELSAMCVPDLLGTQGTFLLFTTRPAERPLQGRRSARIEVDARPAIASRRPFEGPDNMFVVGNPPLTHSDDAHASIGAARRVSADIDGTTVDARSRAC